MSEILAELQAGYAERARMALGARAEPLERAARPKATRTYTGAALERRRAWGRAWGSILQAAAYDLKQEATAGE